MTYIILFEDDLNADPEIRSSFMGAHRAFLDANSDKIVAAGPLGDPAGGLWILDVDDPSEAEALVHADPFWPTGLRKSYTVRAWRKVFWDRTLQ